jgi:hypothetical protein
MPIMSDPRDYRVDIAGLEASKPTESDQEKAAVGRPYLGVQFACCGVYVRIYRNAEATAYDGHCPRCGKAVHFLIGADGTDHRQFVVY